MVYDPSFYDWNLEVVKIEQVWLYTSIFFMAATPWIELLVVIPIGIGLGLYPLWVGIVTYVGNALPVFIIVFAFERIESWLHKRKLKKLQLAGSITESDPHVGDIGYGESEEKQEKRSSKRKEKALSIMRKYGVPGLALFGPLVTGIHLATFMALALKAPKMYTLLWMNISLILWTIVMTTVTALGFQAIFQP